MLINNMDKIQGWDTDTREIKKKIYFSNRTNTSNNSAIIKEDNPEYAKISKDQRYCGET